jgi:hypothetical protein
MAKTKKQNEESQIMTNETTNTTKEIADESRKGYESPACQTHKPLEIISMASVDASDVDSGGDGDPL